MLQRLRLPTIAGVLACIVIAVLAVRAAAVGMLGPMGDRAPLGFVAQASSVDDVSLRKLAIAPLDADRARSLAARSRDLVSRYPLAFNAPFAAAMAAEELGDAAAAEALMRLAVQRNPRNRVARSWLVAKALPRQEYADALVQLDAIMRMQPGLADGMTRAMVGFLVAPGMVDAFAKTAERGAPWMSAFLDVARRDDRVSRQVYALVERLAEQRSPALSEGSAMQVIQSALNRGHYREARQLLLATDAVARADADNFVVDGAFQDDRDERAFGWQVAAPFAYGNAVSLDGRLSIDLRTAAVGDLVSQPIIIGPGGYTLEVAQARGQTRGGDALVWRVTCDGSGGDIAALSVASGGAAAGSAEAAFTVPAGCGVPRLSLSNRRPDATVRASFSRVAIRRAS